MTKRIKIFLVSAVICLMAMATVFTTLNANTANANQKTLTGTKTQAEVTAEVDLSTFAVLDSASIRTESPKGIRFLTTVSKAQVSNLPDNAVFGTLLLPTELLGGAELTVDTQKVADVKAIKYSENGNNYEYLAALVGNKNGDSDFSDFNADYFAKEITARSYVTYTYTDSVEGAKTVTKYTDAVSWSVGQTAGNLLAKKYGELQSEQITYLKEVVNAVKVTAFDAENVPVIYTENMVDGAFDLDLTFAKDVIGVLGDGVVSYKSVDDDTINVTLSDKTATGKVTFLAFTEKATYEITVNVGVNKPVSSYEVGEIVLADDASIALADIEATGYNGSAKITIDDVAVDGVSIADGKINFSKDVAAWGEKTLVVETEDRIINVSATLVTDILTTKEEVSAFANKPVGHATYTGYYKLGANVDMQGATIANGVQNADSKTTGFQGLFDGQGYAIYNFTIKALTEHCGGLFGSIGVNGVVKNLALIQGSWTGDGGSSSFGVIAGGFYGTIENVIVDLTVSGGSSGGNGIFYSTNTNVSTPVIKNTIVRVTNNSTRDGKAYGYPIGNYFRASSDSAKMVVDNVYVIQATTDTSRLGVLADRLNVLDIADSSAWSFSGFDSDIWKTDGAMPVLKNMAVVTESYKENQAGEYVDTYAYTRPAIDGQTLTYTEYTKVNGVSSIIENYSDVASITVNGNTVVEIKYNTYDSLNVLDELGADTGINLEYRDSIPSGHWFNNVGTVNGKENVYKHIHDGSDSWTRRLAFNKDGVNYLAGQKATDVIRTYKTIKYEIMFEEGTNATVSMRSNAHKVSLSNYSEIVAQKDYMLVLDADGNVITSACQAGQWYTVIIQTETDIPTTGHHNVFFIQTIGAGVIYIGGVTLSNVQLPALDITDTEILLSTAQIDGEGDLFANINYTAKTAGETIVWSVENDGIATVDQTGKVTAVANGVTTVTATFTKYGKVYSDTVTINVTKPLVSTPYSAGDIDLTNPSLALTSIGLTVEYNGIANVWAVGVGENGANVALDGVSIEDGKIILPSAIKEYYGEQQLRIELDDRFILADVILITKILSTKQDVLDFVATEKTISGSSETYGGYYILANNINMEGTAIVNAFTTLDRSATDYGFIGTFDGRGYAIMNFVSRTQGGFFGIIGKTAVVKNVAFVNATMENPGSNGNGLIAAATAGTIQDVLVQATINDKAFANMAPFYKAHSTAKFTNVVTIIDVITTRGEAPIPSMHSVTRDDTGATGTNVYGLSEYGIMASNAMSATTYDIWADGKTFNLTSDVWDLTGALPSFKNIALYTMSWYKGDLNGDGKYYAFDRAVGAGEVGDTVTMPATAPVKGTHRITGSAIESLSVTTATLAKGTELKAYYKATNEELMAYNDFGGETYLGWAGYDAANAIVKGVGTIGSQENAFAVYSKSEWAGRVLLSVSKGGSHYSGNLGVHTGGYGYKTATFKIYITNTSKLYMTQNFADGSSASVYFNNSAAKVEMYSSASSWCKVVDASGNEIADGQSLTLNAWYTVTVNIANVAQTMSGTNFLYICTASTTQNSYYLADARLSRTAFGA